jgi:hypothetical protein
VRRVAPGRPEQQGDHILRDATTARDRRRRGAFASRAAIVCVAYARKAWHLLESSTQAFAALSARVTNSLDEHRVGEMLEHRVAERDDAIDGDAHAHRVVHELCINAREPRPRCASVESATRDRSRATPSARQRNRGVTGRHDGGDEQRADRELAPVA